MTDNRTTERVDHPPRVREAIDELMRKKDATNNRTIELKPCPFCGGEAEIEPVYDFKSDVPSGYFVWCHGNDCVVEPMTEDFKTEAKAIEAWNTRAERTCKVKSCLAFSYDFSPEVYYEFKMQCGGSFDWNDEEPPSYCPNCGAKVTKSDQDL